MRLPLLLLPLLAALAAVLTGATSGFANRPFFDANVELVSLQANGMAGDRLCARER